MRLLVVLLSLLLPAVLLAPAVLAQNEGATVPSPAPADDNGFVETFGQPEADGSFRVGFSRQGAGIVWLQSLDHYKSVEAKRKPEHEPGDYLLLLDNPTGDFGLRVFADLQVFAVDPSTSIWQAERLDGEVRFTLADGKGLVLEKIIRHEPQSRGFTVSLKLRNESSEVRGNLALTLSGPALVSPQISSLFGDTSVAIASTAAGDEIVTMKAATDGKVQPLEIDASVVQFAGSTNRFFGAFVWPLDDASRAAMSGFVAQTIRPRPNAVPADNLGLRMRYGLQLNVPQKGQSSEATLGLYIGPKSYRVFEKLPEGDRERFAPILDVDLNPPCCGINIPLGKQVAQFLLWLLGVFYDFLGNWGFAIILLTILVRSCMFPINFNMQKSMRKFGAKMGKLKPQMEAMNKKYADDPKGKQQAMAQFYREHKIVPPVGGCLPMFLTMPIYIGLFTSLRTAYDLRHEPFIAWVDDLSRSDQMFTLGFWPHAFNLLPLLWIALFVFMTLRQPLPNDPQQRQMQMIMRFMPILFGVMLYNYASALLVYMVTSMLWSLVESAIVKKKLGPVDPSAAGMTPTVM
ncbi:MAG: YidC/Oxa1 family insertase periplasmic-domain containing protein [Planctomycetota bacterium]